MSAKGANVRSVDEIRSAKRFDTGLNAIKMLVCGLLVMTMAGCAVSYRVSQVRSEYAKAQRKVDKAVAKMERDLEKKQTAYGAMVGSVADPDMAPYPLLKQSLWHMQRVVADARADQRRVQQVIDRFDSGMKGRKRISSDQPEWEIIEQSKQKIKATFKSLEMSFKQYGNHSNKFVLISIKFSIYKVESDKVRKEIQRFDRQASKSILEARSKLRQASRVLSEQERKGRHPRRVLKNRQTLEAMTTSVDAISGICNEVKTLASRFQETVGNQKRCWVGPGMTAHVIIMEIEEKGEALKKELKTLNSLAGGFKH